MMQQYPNGISFGIIGAAFRPILHTLIQSSPIVGVSNRTFNAMAVNGMKAGLGPIY